MLDSFFYLQRIDILKQFEKERKIFSKDILIFDKSEDEPSDLLEKLLENLYNC